MQKFLDGFNACSTANTVSGHNFTSLKYVNSLSENKDFFLDFRSPYPALIGLAWGTRAGKWVNIFLDLAIFTSNIPELLIGM